MKHEREQNAREQLVAELDALVHDPHGSVILIQEALEIDLLTRLDFDSDIVRDGSGEAIRMQEISADQFEKIKEFEEIVKAFLTHGDLEPRELGLWLGEPNTYLSEYKISAPINVLFASRGSKGFDKEVVRKVCRAGVKHITMHDGGDVAFKSLWED